MGEKNKKRGTMGFLPSAASSLNNGLNAGVGLNSRSNWGTGIKSSFYLGGIGATIGAGFASTMSGGTIDPGMAGVVGAGIGAAALPATGFAVGALGTGLVEVAKTVPGIAKMAGSALISPYTAGFATQGAANVANKIWGVGSKLVDWDSTADALNKVKLTGPISGARSGWNKGTTKREKLGGAISGSVINAGTLLVGEALITGMKKGWNTLESAKMGRMTGVVNMTPRTPSYANDAGATGDLVFAMNANRRG